MERERGGWKNLLPSSSCYVHTRVHDRARESESWERISRERERERERERHMKEKFRARIYHATEMISITRERRREARGGWKKTSSIFSPFPMHTRAHKGAKVAVVVKFMCDGREFYCKRDRKGDKERAREGKRGSLERE